jgi:hypothetical protein
VSDYYFDFTNVGCKEKKSTSKASTLDRARLLEMNSSYPQDEMFGKLLLALADQSETRIKSSAKKMDIATLKKISSVFINVISELKADKTHQLANEMKNAGFSEDELKEFLQSLK